MAVYIFDSDRTGIMVGKMEWIIGRFEQIKTTTGEQQELQFFIV